MQPRLDFLNCECVKNDPEIIYKTQDSIKICFKNGIWPEVKIPIIGDLKGKNSLSFDAFITKGKNVHFILYSSEQRSIVSFADTIKKRVFPTDSWQKVRWYFRAFPGWVSPARTYEFDFDNSLYLSFVGGANDACEEFTVEIKNFSFDEENTADPKLIKQKEYVKNYKKGSLIGKKALIWSNNKVSEGCFGSIENTIKFFKHYENLVGYDGLIMQIENDKKPRFCDYIFDTEDINRECLKNSLEAYKNFDWKHFKHNFIIMDIVATPNPDGSRKLIDWFDDNYFYNIVFPKLTEFCLALKEHGLNIMFDNEAYEDEPYDYFNKYKSTGKSLEEYEEKVRQRGKEVAETIAKAYPNVDVMMTFGPWVVTLDRDQDRYGLLPAFIDGLISADTDIKFIDGYEGGYGFICNRHVVEGEYDVKVEAIKQSHNPKRYKEKLHYGFANWVIRRRKKEEFVEALVSSLRQSQEYVWVYTEGNFPEMPEVQDFLLAGGKEILKQREEELKNR